MKKILITTALIAFMATGGIALADDTGNQNKDDHAMDSLLTNIPDKDAAQFRETVKPIHGKDKALLEKLHTLHQSQAAILTAPKFDKAAYTAKSKEMQKLHDQLHDNMTAGFVKAVSQLNQDERKTLADNMSQEHHHHHDRDKGKSANTDAGDTPASDQ